MKYKYSSTQINLSGDVAADLLSFAASIPDADIDPSDGRETEPHVTVKYGLDVENADAVIEALKLQPPVEIYLGQISCFYATEDRESDVVKVDVYSPDLHALNQLVASAAPHIDTHPVYQPHATIAYVKPGVGKRYAGSRFFEGRQLTADKVVFSARDGSTVEMPLTGTRNNGNGTLMSREAIYLSMGTDAAEVMPALTLGQGRPTHIEITLGGEKKRQPVAYYWKDAIAAGEYIHPTTKQTFKVDQNRIDGWVNNLHAMIQAGREIPTPAGHSDDPRDNLGWVIDAKRNGDRLSLLHQVIGEDGAITAARNACSVKIDPAYIDEKGKNWGDAIVHSAFTPKPVITGMGSFVPFAASRGRQAETPIFYLSATHTGDSPMADLAKLRASLGIAANVPDEQVIAQASERLDTLKTEATTALSRVSELETKVVTLSRAPAAPDPEILQDRAALTLDRIDMAVSKGDLPPFLADKFKAWVKPNNTPSVFMLSRADAMNDRPIDAILKAFDGAKLNPAPGVQAGGVQLLSRETPGGGDAPKPPTQAEIDAELSRTELGRLAIAARK